MSPYCYRKLDESRNEIRIANLLPGTHEQPIQIRLRHVSLRDHDREIQPPMSLEEMQATLPRRWTGRQTLEGRFLFYSGTSLNETISWAHPDRNFDQSKLLLPEPGGSEEVYEALSYVWGSPDDTWSVSVLDGDTASSLQVRSNLLSALQSLRSRTESRLLWIDALCINQDDVEERNMQVQRMVSIFSSASRVIVWLGLESDDSRLALEHMQYLGKQVEITNDNYFLPAPGCLHPDWFLSERYLPWDDGIWRAVTRILHREWWVRVWTRQEIRLANSRSIITCGDTEVSWYHVRRAIMCLWGKLYILSDLPSVGLFEVVDRSSDVAQRWKSSEIGDLLVATGKACCTVPHDKVYSLLGIAPPWFSRTIKPQYSLPVGEVYRQTMLACMEQSKRLDLLPFVSQSDCRRKAPSWVNDWYDMTNDPIAKRAFGSASGISQANVRLLNESTLEAKGIKYGTAQTVSNVPTDTEGLLDFIEQIRRQRARTYVTGESLEDAYMRLLCMDETRDRFPDHSHLSPEWWNSMIPLSSTASQDGWNGWKFLKRKVTNCALVSFDNGFMGLGPTAAQPGRTGVKPSSYHVHTNSTTKVIVSACYSAANSQCSFDRSHLANVEWLVLVTFKALWTPRRSLDRCQPPGM